ncbi:MAG: sigma-70 family RNA polymerase sigma factor, partial [Methylococcales bacterium]
MANTKSESPEESNHPRRADHSGSALFSSSIDRPSARSRASAVDEQRLQEWIVHIVDQDQQAFSALYEAMLGRVYGLALRITRSEPLAEEVTEDTFWQVWRQAPRFDRARGNATAWVMTMARSRAFDALRRIEATQCDGNAESLVDTLAHDKDPFDLLAAFQEGELLHAALKCLDPVPSRLLALAFFKGLSHAEVAGLTGLPLG